MKKLILTTLLGITLTAQAAPSADAPRAPDFDRLAQRLELDATQTEAFKEIMQARHEQRRELMKRILEEKKRLNEETHAQLAGILSDEQLKTLRDLERRPHHRKKFKHLRGPAAEHNHKQDIRPN